MNDFHFVLPLLFFSNTVYGCNIAYSFIHIRWIMQVTCALLDIVMIPMEDKAFFSYWTTYCSFTVVVKHNKDNSQHSSYCKIQTHTQNTNSNCFYVHGQTKECSGKKDICFQTSSHPLLTHKMICNTANIAQSCLDVVSKPARDDCELKLPLVSATPGNVLSPCEGSVFQVNTLPM